MLAYLLELPHVIKRYFPLVISPSIQNDTLLLKIQALSPLPLAAEIQKPADPAILKGLNLFFPGRFAASEDINQTILWTVVVSDNRTFCLETNTPGPCSTRVTVGAVFGQFNPGCPQSTFVFAQDSARVAWQPPKLLIRGTTSLPLSSIHQSGESFPIGTTLVEYADMSEPYQSEESRFRCSFNVCEK